MIYDLADLRVNIQNRCRFTEHFCKDWLSCDQVSPSDMSVSVSNDAFMEEKSMSEGYSDGYIENICLYREICNRMPSFERFLLHSAVLEYHGNAYAFLGRSGTGKSTHTSLWLKTVEGAEMLNGDKPILQVTEQEVFAFGTPWRGKENWGKRGKAPLKGLCFLEQAKENRISRLSEKESANRIFTQILFPPDEENAVKTLELVDKLVKTVPAWLLECDISEQALRCSFETMTGEQLSSVKKRG